MAAPVRSEPAVSPSLEFRHHMGRVSRQSAVFFLGSIFSASAGYVFKLYLARTLGAEGLGVYALGMTLAGFLGIFSALGLPQSAVRFVAAYRATGQMERLRAYLVRSLVALMAGCVALGAILVWSGAWISGHLYRSTALSPYLGWFALILFTTTCSSFLGQVLAGYKDVTRRTVVANFIGSPLMMGLTVLLISLGLGLPGYLAAQVASALVVSGLLLFSVWRLTPRVPLSAKPVPMEREVFSFCASAFAMDFLAFLMGQSDKVLIGYYLTARAVGIYSVAAGLVVFVPIFLQAINQIFAPTIADLHARGEHALLGRMFHTLTKWTMALTLPLALVMMVFARPLMRMFGAEFEAGWPVLVIGALGQLVNCGVGSVGYLLLMAGKQNRLMRIQAGAALVMLGLNLALVPRWGGLGAAVAAALTVAITNLWSLHEVRGGLGLSPFKKSYLALLLPLTASLSLLWLLRAACAGYARPWLVIAAATTIAYAVFLGISLTFGVDEDDRLILRAVRTNLRLAFASAGRDLRRRFSADGDELGAVRG